MLSCIEAKRRRRRVDACSGLSKYESSDQGTADVWIRKGS